MFGLILLGVFALLAGAAYLVALHGSQLGLAFNDAANEASRRHRDALRGAKIFGDVGGVLKGHKHLLHSLLSLGPPDGKSSSRSSLAGRASGLVKQNEDAGNKLQAQLRELQELSSAYGDLFDNEQRNIESYCDWTDKLDAALRTLEQHPCEESDRIALALARQMMRENDRLRSRISGCESQIVALMSDMSRLEREARTDSLTQLPNRRAWDERLADPASQEGVFVMLDLDRFKEINDTHGHSAGDGVLTLVATMMRNTAEVEPYRIAGDEFAMIASPRVWSRIGSILENLRSRIEKASLNADGQRIQITVSLGAALRREDEPIERVLRRADEGLYASKKLGGNRLHLHDGAEVQPFRSPTEPASPAGV